MFRYHSTWWTFPEIKEYSMKEVYVKHPTKRNLWRYVGRKDDVIVLSNGEKFNRTSIKTLFEIIRMSRTHWSLDKRDFHQQQSSSWKTRRLVRFRLESRSPDSSMRIGRLLWKPIKLHRHMCNWPRIELCVRLMGSRSWELGRGRCWGLWPSSFMNKRLMSCIDEVIMLGCWFAEDQCRTGPARFGGWDWEVDWECTWY